MEVHPLPCHHGEERWGKVPACFPERRTWRKYMHGSRVPGKSHTENLCGIPPQNKNSYKKNTSLEVTAVGQKPEISARGINTQMNLQVALSWLCIHTRSKGHVNNPYGLISSNPALWEKKQSNAPNKLPYTGRRQTQAEQGISSYPSVQKAFRASSEHSQE